MTLQELNAAPVEVAIRFVGKAVPTNIFSTSGKVTERYYKFELAKPVEVACSVDENVPVQEVDFLYIRESAKNSTLWEKDADGMFIPNWLADFSVGQEFCVYQQDLISTYIKESRNGKGEQKRTSVIDKIQADMADRRAKKAAAAAKAKLDAKAAKKAEAKEFADKNFPETGK